MHPPDETILLAQAGEWLTAQGLPCPGADRFASLAAERGIDFATAALYHAFRRSPRHGPFIEAIEAPGDPDARSSDDVLIVPGAFYRESPHTGADGRLVRQAAEAQGRRVESAPLHSFGTVADNAEQIADCLRRRGGRPCVLVSHSKGALEVRHLMTRPDAAELFAQVTAWVDLSGLFHGTPLVAWLRARPVRWWLVRLLFLVKGYPFAALGEIDRVARPSYVDVSRTLVIHVVGVPLARHLTAPIVRRGHRRLTPLGPNDGAVVLADYLNGPGLVYPVWGADHYLRPPGRDVSPLVSRLIGFLAESARAKEFA